MRQSLIVAALLLVAPALASAQDKDLERLFGGSPGELRGVLDLKEDQVEQLRKLTSSMSEKLSDLHKAAKNKGVDNVREDYHKLQADTAAEMQKLLTAKQRDVYFQLLSRKSVLAGEFEKALLGIPPVVEMKLKLALPVEDCDAMQKAADDAVATIRARIADMKGTKETPESITTAVNEIRRDGITKMVAACSKPSQNKVRDLIKWYLSDVESKLVKPDVERLSRVIGALAVKDDTVKKDVRLRVAAVLMHRAELAWGVKSLIRELMLLMVGQKTEAAIWERLSEYGALNDIHRKRLKDLQDDLKKILGGKDIGKLVSEGILEE